MPRGFVTHADIIDALGIRRAGEICGFREYPAQRGNDMRRRNSIPSKYWAQIASEAERIGLPITVDTLNRTQPPRTTRRVGA